MIIIRKYSLIWQLIFIFLSVLIFMTIIQPMSNLQKEKKFLKDEVLPLKNNNFDEYFKKVSIFANFSYQKTEIVSETVSDNKNTIKYKFYKTRKYYENNLYIDGIIMFIDYAEYNNQHYDKLEASIIYNESKSLSSNEVVNSVNLESITNKSFFPAFFISNYQLSINEMTTIKEIRIHITTSNDESKPLIVFSNEKSTDYTFSRELSKYPFTYESYTLDKSIKNKKPTIEEMTINNLYYNEDTNYLKKYSYIIVIWYSFYIILILILSYFILFRPLLNLKKEMKK